MAQENQQQDRADEELVLISKQVRIGLSNYRIAFKKHQPDVIYRLYLQFWHTISLDLSTQTYFFILDDQRFKVGTDLLHDALQITLKDPDHPFIEPPPHDKIVSFIKKLGYPGSLDQVSKMVINHIREVNKETDEGTLDHSTMKLKGVESVSSKGSNVVSDTPHDPSNGSSSSHSESDDEDGFLQIDDEELKDKSDDERTESDNSDADAEKKKAKKIQVLVPELEKKKPEEPPPSPS
ncbi:hypothetical protein Tco_1106319 [Tanacetum coccineum]